MELNTIPRAAMKVTLQGLRCPITGVEALTGQRGNESWPPAMAFESFEAGVKQFLGSITRDEELVDEGRIQQAKVTELRRAVDLEVKADQKRAAADRELREQRTQAEQARRKAEAQSRQREEEIHRDKRAAERRANNQLDERAAAIDEAAQVRDKRVSAVERQAQLTRVDEEAAALKEQSRAVEATRAAATAADAVEQKKTERKTR